MYVLLLSDWLHRAFLAVAHQARGRLACWVFATLAEELADLLRKDGDAGLEVVAALMHLYVALAAE